MDSSAFKTKFEADTVADIVSKQPIDASTPCDAAAKLACEANMMIKVMLLCLFMLATLLFH